MDSQKSEEKPRKTTAYAIAVVLAAAVGGLLFGYDQGVMSGALKFIAATFKLSTGMEGFISGSVPLGAMLGCILAGIMADFWGRRPTLIVAAILFAVSSFGLGFSHSVGVLVFFRLISGLAVGLASTLVPLYIAEIAPKHIRGRMVGGYQLAIVSGSLIVYLINLVIVSTHSNAWNLSDGWRYMFFAGAVPGIIFLVLLLFVPESLRYLIRRGKKAKAEEIIKKVNGPEFSQKEIDEEVGIIETSLVDEGKGMWGELLAKGFRLSLIVGVLIAIFQQLTGVSAISYYGPMIFAAAGFGENASLLYTVGIGICKVIMVICLMLIVDKVGRKFLLVLGATGMALMMFGLAAAFTQVTTTTVAGAVVAHASLTIGILVIAAVLIHTTFYEFSFGGGAWILISELFPTRIRGRAMSICSFMLWGATYAVTQLFPMMLANLGSTMTYLIFGAFCVIMGLFAHFAVHETKGKSLEEIQEETANR